MVAKRKKLAANNKSLLPAFIEIYFYGDSYIEPNYLINVSLLTWPMAQCYLRLPERPLYLTWTWIAYWNATFYTKASGSLTGGMLIIAMVSL